MYKYCYSNLGAIYAKGPYPVNFDQLKTCGGYQFYLSSVSSSKVQMSYRVFTEPRSDLCGNMIQISLEMSLNICTRVTEKKL